MYFPTFPSVAALRAAPVPTFADSAFLTGYHAPGDGGGGEFYWAIASTLADDGGAVIHPTGHTGAGRWLRFITGPLNVRWWGATGDSTTDDYPAFAAVLAYIDAKLGIQNFPPGLSIFVPQGTYRLSQTLFLNRPIELFGEGHQSSILTFRTRPPSDLTPGDPIDGIVIQRHRGIPPPVATFHDASHARVRRLGITGDGASYVLSQAPYPLYSEFDPISSGPTSTGHPDLHGNGIVILAHNGTADDCAVGGFKFDGIHVEAAIDTDNANDWAVRDCFVYSCGRHGLFVCGGESANAGYGQGNDINGCSGWGVYDRSFLGNAYHATQTAENGVYIRDVLALAIDPGYQSGATGVTYGLFAGSKQGGTYFSADSGVSWVSHNVGLQNVFDTAGDNAARLVAVTSLAADGSKLYAGSGAVNTGIQGGGVYTITTALGIDQWAQSNTGITNTDIRAVAAGNNVVLAGSTGSGVFRSTDAGHQFAASNSGLTASDVRALVYDASNAGTFYAGTHDGGVFKSTDSGASWVPAASGTAAAAILCVAVAPNVVYAGSADGKIFQLIGGTMAFTQVFSEPGGRAIQSLVVNLLSTAKVYAATQGAGVYVSVDAGANWAQRNNGLVDPQEGAAITDIRAVISAPDGKVYVGVIGNHYTVDNHNNGGVFSTSDDGASWTSVGGGLRYGGGYSAIGGLAQTIFYGCYAEGDQNNWIVPPSIVVGGILAAEMAPPPPGVFLQVIGPSAIYNLTQYGTVRGSVRQISASQAMFVQSARLEDRFVLIDVPSNQAAVFVMNNANVTPGQLLTIQKSNTSTYELLIGGLFEGGLTQLVLIQPFATITLLATAANEWKILNGKNLNKASINEAPVPTTTANYPMFGLVPIYPGNHLVSIYYRVVTAATDVKLVVQWGDVGGAQSQTLVDVMGQAIGSYALGPVALNCIAGLSGEIIVRATVSAANHVILSCTAELLS